MKDRTGNVIGFEKLNYLADKPLSFQVAFETVAANLPGQPDATNAQ